jgi:hypothetical protein
VLSIAGALLGTPSTEDLLTLLACAALAAGTLIFIFWIQPDPGDSVAHRSRLDQLLERRDAIYDNLRDLKFEYRAGKYSEQDYEATKESLENEAALVLAQIEQLTGGTVRPGRRTEGAVSAAANPGERAHS